ncbi:MAG: MotA/TolQ/ExbB proton channel family protein [Verrucomicrobiota bacterium]|nr:MotA/TolQ/ExbB proton channel family protein [Verrucomicrobiota bacterium]
MFKSSQLIGACAAALLFALPGLSAQPSNNPAGAGEETIKSTIVENQPEQVSMEKKTLWELIKNGGLMMWPLALLALYGFFKAGVQVYVIILSNNQNRDEALLGRLNPHDMPFDDLKGEVASDINQRAQSAFPKMCEAALARLYEGKGAMEDALSREGAMQLSRLKRGLKPLQSVVTVAPLLGLMGTVYGMIASFQSLGATGDKVEILSKGIYEALVTTAAGLTIAIPFLFIYQWLNHRVDEIGENLNRQAEAFLGKFHPSGGGGIELEQDAQAGSKVGSDLDNATEETADSDPLVT